MADETISPPRTRGVSLWLPETKQGNRRRAFERRHGKDARAKYSFKLQVNDRPEAVNIALRRGLSTLTSFRVPLNYTRKKLSALHSLAFTLIRDE